jgi:hypothetical protein
MHGGFWHRFRCPNCDRSTPTLRLENREKAVCRQCARYLNQPPLPLAEKYAGRSSRHGKRRRQIALEQHHLRMRAEALEPFK